MWKNFQKVLEKRVNKKQKLSGDKQLVMKVAADVLGWLFGSMGSQKIQLRDFNNKTISLKINESVWRSEIKLREKEITREINNKLKQKVVERIKIEH
ncbi:MAG: DciA family protein [Candidatus Moranbacteria bacterium]|nr:DciA family protein [Candidatus Moranbacteria bacterium]